MSFSTKIIFDRHAILIPFTINVNSNVNGRTNNGMDNGKQRMGI